MAQKFAFGIKSMKSGGIDPVTGLPTALEDVGDIYKDTGEWIENDGTTTPHRSEFKNTPVVTVVEPGDEEFRFTLMDTSAKNLAKLCGGTVTEVIDQPDVWNKPKGVPNIEMSFVLQTEDGTEVTIHRGKVVGKRRLTPTRTGMFLIDVAVTPQEPLIADLPAVTSKDPVI